MKGKILDYILIFILAFFLVSFFQGKPVEKHVEQKTGVTIDTKTSFYTVPASIKLNIENNTDKKLNINTCDDISISYNSQPKKIEDKNFCKDLEIAPGKKETIKYDKFYNTFINAGNYSFKLNLGDKKEVFTNFDISIRGVFGKFFTFFFYAPVYNLIVYLIDITGNSLFWAIILITLIVRIILIWPQHKMLDSQKKMQVIQPKIKALQEKHKGNHQILGQEMMKLYKEEKVNPMGSCGLLIIQMPILLVLYNIIMYIRDESNLFYLYSFLGNFDISQIQSVYHGIDLYGKGGKTGVILGLTVAALQFLQVKYSMKNNKVDDSKALEKKKDDNSMASMMPDQKVMQKFMLFVLPVMVGFFTYNFPAGLGIYWGVTTFFILIQQLIVNKILKKSS